MKVKAKKRYTKVIALTLAAILALGQVGLVSANETKAYTTEESTIYMNAGETIKITAVAPKPGYQLWWWNTSEAWVAGTLGFGQNGGMAQPDHKTSTATVYAKKQGSGKIEVAFYGSGAPIYKTITIIIGPAQEKPTTRQYTATFQDYDGTTIDTKDYDEGTSGDDIVFPADPIREADENYTYTFIKWDREVPDTITENLTFTAQYEQISIQTETGKYYFRNDTVSDGVTIYYSVDGGDLQTIDNNGTVKGFTEGEISAIMFFVHIDESYETNGIKFTAGNQQGISTTVEKAPNTLHNKNFVNAKQDAMAKGCEFEFHYSAFNENYLGEDKTRAFKVEAANLYTVIFQDYDGNQLSKEVYYEGDTIVVPKDPTREADEDYTYEFAGWTPAVPETVTGDTTFIAKYDRTVIESEEPATPPEEPTTPTTPTPAPTPAVVTPAATPALLTAAVPAATATIEDEPTPLATIEDEPTPKAAAQDHWALLNLILTVLTVLMSIALAVLYFTGKRRGRENGDEMYAESGDGEAFEIKRKGILRILSGIWAVTMIVVFFLTEDMTLPMGIVDEWTWLMAVMAVVQVAILVFSKKKYEETEEACQ